MKRPKGTGRIEPMPDGRFRGRMPGDGPRLPPREKQEDAEADLAEALAQVQERALLPPVEGLKLGASGRRWITERGQLGYRNEKKELDRWTVHVESTELGGMALRAITRGDIIRWRNERLAARVRPGRGQTTTPRRTVSRSTVKDALRLVRGALDAAVERGLLERSPAEGVKLPKDPGRTREHWTHLRPAEVRALLALPVSKVVPEEERDLVLVALYTGVRQGELWTLHRRDVDLVNGRITVRYGGRRSTKLLPTKSGRVRTLELLPPALDAIRRQMARRPEASLLFPSPTKKRAGMFRAIGTRPRAWARMLELAGLVAERREDGLDVRWHDLRHTFATLMLAGRMPGAEGEGWRIERVSAYLGHSDIQVTQRYAHASELLRTERIVDRDVKPTNVSHAARWKALAKTTRTENLALKQALLTACFIAKELHDHSEEAILESGTWKRIEATLLDAVKGLPARPTRAQVARTLCGALDRINATVTPPPAEADPASVGKSSAIPGRVELPTNGLGNRTVPK